MDTLKQALRGWLYSLLAPFIVSVIIGAAELVTIGDGRESSMGERLEAGFSMYLGWSFLGLCFTAIISAVIGVPLFLFVKKLGLLDSRFFFLVGCILGGIVFYKEPWWFLLLFALYGGVAARLFWFGAVKQQSVLGSSD